MQTLIVRVDWKLTKVVSLYSVWHVCSFISLRVFITVVTRYFYNVFMIECNSFVCACNSKTCLTCITSSIGYRRLHTVYYRLFVYMFADRVCDERPGRYVNRDRYSVKL